MKSTFPLSRLDALKAPGRYSMVGGPFGSKLVGSDYVATGVPVVRGSNLPPDRRFSFDDLVFVTEEKVESDLVGNLAFPGDIVVTQRGTLGQVGLIPDSSPFPRLVVSQSQMKLSVDQSKADPLFVYYVLKSPIGQHEIHSRAMTAGVPHINLSLFQEIQIPLPPLPTQSKIAAVLSTYDELVENNIRRISVLEEMSQRIYHSWFTEFRYPGNDAAMPLLDSEIGQIPTGWKLHSLSDLVSTQYGYTESATTDPVGPQFLRGMDVNKSTFIDWAKVPYCPISSLDHQKYKLVRGDVVVIRMADPGKVGIVETDVDAVFASYLIRVRPTDDRIDPYVLFYFMSSHRYQEFVTGASTGATRKSLSAPLITSIRLPLPPMSVQRAFVSRILPLRMLLTNLVQTNTHLRMSRDYLLPRLISGEIGVDHIVVPEAAA